MQLLVLKGFLSTFEITAPLVSDLVLNWRLALVLVLVAFAPTRYVMQRLMAPTMHAADRAHAALRIAFTADVGFGILRLVLRKYQSVGSAHV